MATETKERITNPVGGMHYASCVKKGENALAGDEGVRDGRDEQVIGELLELYELANK